MSYTPNEKVVIVNVYNNFITGSKDHTEILEPEDINKYLTEGWMVIKSKVVVLSTVTFSIVYTLKKDKY